VREVTGKERLVRRDVLHRDDALARLALLHPVDHDEGIALRQVREDCVDVHLSHFSFLCGEAPPRRGPTMNVRRTDTPRYRYRARSEERRVGKECRSRWSPEH